jgi:hypothetical protein
MPTYRTNDGRTFQANDPADLVEKLRQAADGVAPVFEPGGTADEFRARSAQRATTQLAEPAIRNALVGDWYSDMNQRGLIQEVPAEVPPDFERTVTVILTTFAAFTGFTINGYLSIIDIGNLADWRWWGFFSLVALLLRYIFGSAIHLNSVYVGKSLTGPAGGWFITRGAPQSQLTGLLFKDLVFLVLFGMLAIYIEQAAKSNDIDGFVQHSMWFLAAGFLWSVSDYFIRRFCCGSWWWRYDPPFLVGFGALTIWVILAPDVNEAITRSIAVIALGIVLACLQYQPWLSVPRNDAIPPAREWPNPFWRKWTLLDGVQFLLAWLILILPSASPTYKAMALTVLFGVFLYLDFRAMIRAVQQGQK